MTNAARHQVLTPVQEYGHLANNNKKNCGGRFSVQDCDKNQQLLRVRPRTNVSPVILVTVRCLHLAVLAAGCRKENRANELRRSWEFVYQSSIWGGTSWGQANSAVWFTWYAVEKGALFSCFVCTSFALKNSIRTRMDRGHRKHLWYPFKTAIGLSRRFQSKSVSYYFWSL